MKPLEHDIVRPWQCCSDCRNRYERERRRAHGRPVEQQRLKDETISAQRHDDKIDALLEVLHGT